jgi:hypothetical protein
VLLSLGTSAEAAAGAGAVAAAAVRAGGSGAPGRGKSGSPRAKTAATEAADVGRAETPLIGAALVAGKSAKTSPRRASVTKGSAEGTNRELQKGKREDKEDMAYGRYSDRSIKIGCFCLFKDQRRKSRVNYCSLNDEARKASHGDSAGLPNSCSWW